MRVVHRFTPSAQAGIGDFLRGSCSLYEITKRTGDDLIIDFTGTDCGQFIGHDTTIAGEPVQLCNIGYGVVLDYLASHSDPIIITNIAPARLPSQECKNFIKYSIEPKPLFRAAIGKVRATLPPQYTAVHIRLQDDLFHNDTLSYQICAIVLDHLLRSHLDSQQVLIIASNQSVQKYFGDLRYLTIPCNPVHTAGKSSLHDIQQTLLTMFLIAEAQQVMQFSVYCWGSGYSYWIAAINDIPVKTVKI